jgi:hypothetical protein
MSIFLVNFTSLIIITVAGLVSPYKDPILNAMQLVNESFVILLTYHLCLFTNFVKDVNVRE